MRTAFWIAIATTATLPTVVHAQIPEDQAVTILPGTWSSGSKAVRTGAGFANPNNLTFTYPKTAGIAFSFDTNNNYEIARYRFQGNATNPNCISGTIGWVHGTVDRLTNGSLVLQPMEPGYQQVQAKCFAQSSWIENYNFTELYIRWQIFLDPTSNEYHLHLFQFDGAPLPPLKKVSDTPDMLPTVPLRRDPGINATGEETSTPATRKRSLEARTNGSTPLRRGVVGGLALATLSLLGLTVFVL